MEATAPTSPKEDAPRRHVTTACVACRESKVKCNGSMPSCARCLSGGKVCQYKPHDDKRKLPLRGVVELLAARVRELSQFISEHGLEVPPMRTEDTKTLSYTLKSLKIANLGIPPVQARPHDGNDTIQESSATSDPEHSAQPSSSMEGLTHNSVDVPSSDNPQVDPFRAAQGLMGLANVITDNATGYQSAEGWNITAESMIPDSETYPGRDPAGLASYDHVPQDSVPIRQSGFSNQRTCSSIDVDDNVESVEHVDDLANQLSDCVGTLHIRPEGHIRFYGPTSSFSLLRIPATDVSMNVHRTVRDDGAEHLDRLGLNKTVPPAIEEHLMELYFTWQDPSCHVVDRGMFERSKAMCHDQFVDTAYYSQSLRNAICALGAAFDNRYHPTFLTFPRSVADFFADRAKALLEIEIDSPCVATIQSLILLSSHDIGCGRDARGWIFSGMATRLSFNLGLHQDLEPYIAKGVVNRDEADVRRTVFWAAFIVDHVWSFHLGQPFRMSMKGVTLDRPTQRESSEPPGQWIPYTSPTGPQTLLPVSNYTEEVFRNQVSLFSIIAHLCDAFHGGATSSKSDMQALHAMVVKRLASWKNSLEIVLSVDLHDRTAVYLPHVLLLHMQYYQGLIHAHRPWMSRSGIQQDPIPGFSSSSSQKICMDSASAIAQLLRLYEERYTLRRINIQAVAITLSAALLLVFASVSRYKPEGENDLQLDLNICSRALDELSSAWDTARRARDFLIRVQRLWAQRSRIRSIHSDYEVADTGNGYAGTRKRRCVPSDERPGLQMWGGDDMSSTASHLTNSGNGGSNFGTDIDFDWMLRTSIEGMPGDWGNIFAILPNSMGLD